MRVAVVDLGSNSTRLLLADVQDGRVTAVHDRRSVVTRLGDRVEATGVLADDAIARVLTALEGFRPALARADVRLGVLTSAVRDAANGPAFCRTVAERFGLDARTLPGEEEARLSFLGATSEHDPADPATLLVVDIGGGSTELVAGACGRVLDRASLPLGVVRFSERHLHGDPPTARELAALRADARAVLEGGRPRGAAVDAAIAVAGTPLQLASVDLRLGPQDGDRAHGHRLTAGRVEALLAGLAALPLAERRRVPGLDPERAPVIVAGAAILAEVLAALGLEEVEASEHDLLRGAALDAAAARA